MMRIHARWAGQGMMMLFGLCLVFILVQVAWVRFNGDVVPRPVISRQPQTLGQGAPLRYVVMGDSTSVSQGGEYDRGYAVASAAHLAKNYEVTWQNVGESGARAADVLHKQLPQILPAKPDVVLIAVGANDVTHLTGAKKTAADIAETIHQLQDANPRVQVVLTGAPDMGSVPRFPYPLRQLAGWRTAHINAQVAALADGKRVQFAPIATQTGPTFRAHPELFAADKFHPTTAGYELWIPVITAALDQL